MCAASALGLSGFGLAVHADELPEYRLKAGFLYNFIVYTEWPATTGSTLSLCIAGTDPFGGEIDALQGKTAGSRSIAVQRKTSGESFKNCQVIFVSPSAMEGLARLVAASHGQAALIVADSPGAIRQGAALNMLVQHNKVTFEASVPAARNAGLVLSSKLLRLATEVEQ